MDDGAAAGESGILTFYAGPCYNNQELNDSKALTKTETMASLTESRGEVEAR